MWTNGTDLSLGQWQKIAISRAFMSDACMLILDEPTASLDAEAEYELFQNFRELIGNATCVLISHRFSTVKMADIIYVIENGHIVEAGDHKQLMSKGALYHKLFNMQAEAYNLKTDKDNVENSDMPA
jgi:ABC-type multidrug transport system fused ATPase/permease subunit